MNFCIVLISRKTGEEEHRQALYGGVNNALIGDVIKFREDQNIIVEVDHIMDPNDNVYVNREIGYVTRRVARERGYNRYGKLIGTPLE